MTAIHFLYLPVYMTKVFLLVLKISLGMLHNNRDKSQRYRKDKKCHYRHKRTDTEHHDQYTDNRCHGSNDLRCALIQALT